jgi:malonyl-CoA decarboxylase
MFLKKIVNAIADAGKELLGKNFSDKKSLIELCDDIISFKGVASGIAIARQIAFKYKNLTNDEKLNFFLQINERYKANLEQVQIFADDFLKDPTENSLNKLNSVSEGMRQELIRRMNMAPNGTLFLVNMREDLIKFLPKNPELKSLDSDLRHLFKSWFNPGFLSLEKITWETKAAILEKIIKYEKVHQIRDMNDLKRRLDEDRRFYAYFHPVLKDEPLIFVQVAFTKGIGDSIQEIIKPKTSDIKNADTATFYSISNCQEGLMRVTLGNFLIKRVVFEIQEEHPEIKNFGTLSPLPGFATWFMSLDKEKLKNILKDYDISKLDFLRSPNLKIGDTKMLDEKKTIKRLVAHYLINEKTKSKKPLNPVSRFHLGNGASIHNILINGNASDYGYKESFGIMVNYSYQLDKLEKIHEEFITKGIISYSDKIKKYV